MEDTSTCGKQHILVVGMDGIRYDSLLAARTPFIDALAKDGVLLPVRVHEKNYTISGPVWSTVATGVYMDRHGMVGNSIHPPEMAQFQDFTAYVRGGNSGLETMVAVSWFPLAADVECGPIFSSRGWTNPVEPGAENTNESRILADDDVAAYASGRLRSEDLAVSFVYFGEADIYAHNHGTGSGYIAAIERCDARLGVLLRAVDSRETRAGEDWTVVVVTDHGHLDAGGHGGDSDEERTAWIVASGQNLPTDITALDHADIAAHVLHTFGIPVDDLDGVPFGSR